MNTPINPGLTLYTHPFSRGRTARWMLEECGVPYDTQVVEYFTSMKAPAYLTINPMGKVPALKHGDVVVTENAAICAYLADAFPSKNLAPAVGSSERGSYYRWLFFAAAPMEEAISAKSMGTLAPKEKASHVGYGTYDDVINTLEKATTHAVQHGGYLCGKQFTAADLYLAAYLSWFMQFGMIEKRAAFERYCAPILQRPAHVRAQALDDELSKKYPMPT